MSEEPSENQTSADEDDFKVWKELKRSASRSLSQANLILKVILSRRNRD